MGDEKGWSGYVCRSDTEYGRKIWAGVAEVAKGCPDWMRASVKEAARWSARRIFNEERNGRGGAVSDQNKTCWFTTQPCPECGKPLATNGRDVWCVECGGGCDG